MNVNEEYQYMEAKEILQAIEEAETWDMVDVEVYEDLCDRVGLDYDAFDDPDELFEALAERIE
ncbi:MULTISPECIES: hypothetical protein [Aerococcus]|uniref:Uncharacterized protein n=1 Tax=Aerococcus tenax TaxID=3078812 RepID=A0A329PJK2_9LACT|nr:MULTISPECIES: hypothetical protein [Aerococcus]MDL5184737.1 hypothetical protein [Aerococcus mictus]KAA9238605.1 hypothetical protein F6I34_08150 [Aerococcus urinae]MDK6371962.1 hypothetical protein [Aerococcus urinae]MDK7302403.1 hypothetical protein [Aerococcus urinae]MDK7802261.1 hypothetical protein [Aerococcus urinae]